MSAYTPSKCAVTGLAECLRQEMILHGIDVHCVLPGSIQSPGLEKENMTKPSLTREIEGDDAMSPEAVAKGTLEGILKRQTFIVLEPIGELLLATNTGFLPVNNYIVHVLCLALSVVLCPILRAYFDWKVRSSRSKVLKSQ